MQPIGTQPGGRFEHAMAEDAHRGRAVLFGGFDDDDDRRRDTWEWDGTAWTELVTQRMPDIRSGHTLAYDPDRDRIVLFGGDGLNDRPAAPDVWELHADPNQRPGIEVSFAWTALGIDPSTLRTFGLRAAAGGQGYTDAASTTGAELAVWNARLGRWETWASNAAQSSAPALLTSTFSTASAIGSFVTWADQVHVLLRARAGIGAGPGMAAIVGEGAELRVTYEFPD
jgi:hypothetical protein